MVFDRQFSNRTKYVAPVQTRADEWQDYFSTREKQDYDQAERGAKNGFSSFLAGAGLVGAALLLGSTTLGGFALLAGAGMIAYGAPKTLANALEGTALENRAKARQGDIEVFRRHGMPTVGLKP